MNKGDDRIQQLIAKNITAIRKSLGYKNAADVAEAIGLLPATYANYETGRRAVPMEVAWALADLFCCSLDELMGRPGAEQRIVVSNDEKGTMEISNTMMLLLQLYDNSDAVGKIAMIESAIAIQAHHPDPCDPAFEDAEEEVSA